MLRGVAIAVLLAIATPTLAHAQCGAKRSTCAACHDGERAPFDAKAAWHADHGFVDLCVACHGGVGDAKDEAAAHVGVARAASESACASCHGAATPALASRYARAPAASGPPPRVAAHGDALPNAILATFGAAFGLASVVWLRRRHERAIA